jgi:quinoprotein glucose dehydrogenase
MLYLATESPTNDGYGGHRPGDNLYSDSIVCLNIKTGKNGVVQAAHPPRYLGLRHAVPAHPDRHHRRRKADQGDHANRQDRDGICFDRTNGRPVWPMPDVPVPQTDVPTEWTPATQPIPTKPPAFDYVGVKIDDLINFTPALREEALRAVEGYRLGPPFAPPSVGGQRQQRNDVAPASAAERIGREAQQIPRLDLYTSDHYTRRFVAVLYRRIHPIRIAPLTRRKRRPGAERFRAAVLKPPYGRITAYDMNKRRHRVGDSKWRYAPERQR